MTSFTNLKNRDRNSLNVWILQTCYISNTKHIPSDKIDDASLNYFVPSSSISEENWKKALNNFML